MSRRLRQLGLAGASGIAVAVLLGLAIHQWRSHAVSGQAGAGHQPAAAQRAFVGSASCRECHGKFYELWATSHHGLAMQVFTPAFAEANLSPQDEDMTIGKVRYRAELDANGGRVRERAAAGARLYEMAHVMGGKNVYYFLTPMDRGRLQVLPIAYDIRLREWYETAASGVRHFHGRRDDAPLHWTDSAYTFNTSCYGCHVSQLSTNYDLKADTYRTTWAEPGINCETCHGPASEHVRVCKAAAKGKAPNDLKLTTATVSRGFTVHQANASCAPCHAKMRPLTTTFKPGDRYFDHHDLVTLEHPDFYPDGRDLGENYTYTSWRMSPCVKSGKLDCLHCHTSSGRYRHKDDPDQSCLPCHQARVEDAAAHHRHPKGKPGSHCVDCHMPTTEFARMRRSDHSMLPPTPAATIEFKAPNACNICHSDKDAPWSDKLVREWRRDDYQAPVLHRAGLIAAARKGDWKRLTEMLEYLKRADRDEVTAASLIRLLASCEDERKYPALIQVLKDSSPLVRSAAAGGLAGRFTAPGIEALLRATTDEYRLVRTQAAQALSGLPVERLSSDARVHVARANDELIASLSCRPDDWSSHYNRGNLLLSEGKPERAAGAFQTAAKLRPDAVMPLVNASIAYARLGQDADAERALRKAVELGPANAAANFNLGLLLAGKGDRKEAERRLRMALKADPGLAQAAYNLGVLLADDRLAEAIGWLRRAVKLQSSNPTYTYTLAFYLVRSGKEAEASVLLESLLIRSPAYVDAYMLLGAAYEKQGDTRKAMAVYRRAAANESLPPRARRHFEAKLRALSPERKTMP